MPATDELFKVTVSQLVILATIMILKRSTEPKPTDRSSVYVVKDFFHSLFGYGYEFIKATLLATVVAFVGSFGLTPQQWSDWLVKLLHLLFITLPYYFFFGLFKPIEFTLEGGKRR